MRRLLVLLGAVFALVVTLAASPASALANSHTTTYVDDDGRAGPGRGCAGGRVAPTSIQRAIDASDQGDTILVCPGRYKPFIIRGSSHDGLTIKSTVAWGARVVLEPKAVFATPFQLRFIFAVQVADVRDVTIQDLHIKAAIAEMRICSPSVLVRYKGASGRILGNRLTSPAEVSPGWCGRAWEGILAVAARGSSIAESVEVRGNVIKTNGSSEIVIRGDGDVANGQEMEAIVAGNILHRAQYAIDGIGGGISAADARVSIVDNAMVHMGMSASYSTATILRNRLDHAVSGISFNCSNGIVADNTIHGASFGANGLVVSGRSGKSWIERNSVTGFIGGMGEGSLDGKGIWVPIDSCLRSTGAAAPRLVIRDNDFRGNGEPACADHTSGDGTAGTANVWRRNMGDESVPAGICTPTL